MNRLALLLALSAMPALAASKPNAAKDQAALRPIAWEGRATIHAGGRRIDIRVRTRIDARGNVVSESWPVDQGEAGLRRMIIDETGGWMERGGKREPMPREMLEHERQQFGFYTQLQQAILRRDLTPVTGTKIKVEGLVTTRFGSNYNRIPFNATNTVTSPEPGEKPIPQMFILQGEIVSNGQKWPRKIQIYQYGKLFFDLKIEKFEAGAVP